VKGIPTKLLFLIIIIVCIIIVSIAAASGGGNKNHPGVYTATIKGTIGLDTVTITNQNTGKTIIRTAADLPYTFNFENGDTFRLNVTTLDGYKWNAWEINQSPWFAQDNPLLIKVSGNVEFKANCLFIGD
jgi:hypothetical protein